MSKVYDCFPFFNEMDIMEIRFNELNNIVDYFVVVEATRTHQKKEKELFLDLNDKRIKKFKEKIIHIVVDDYPNFFTKWRRPKAWDYEKHQRKAIERGLVNVNDDDIILISDADEIPRAEKIIENITFKKPMVFQQLFSYYFLNFFMTDAPEETCTLQKNGLIFWRGSVMTRYKDFKDANLIRNLRSDSNTLQIENGGWHFSYIGNIDFIINKLKASPHAKEAKQALTDLDDRGKIEKVISSGGDLFNRDMSFKAFPISESFPRYVVENLQRFESLLCKI